MDVNQYLSIIRRWLWLLILGLVTGLVSGYVIAALQTPVYQSTTRVVVSRASMQTASGASSSNNIYDYFLSDQVLIQTYVELLKASSIFEQVSQIVNYPVSPSQVTAEQVNETRIISITAEDTNPQRAADIAIAVVMALIAQNEELEAGRYKASDESLQIQIRQVEEQIAKYQDDLDNLANVTIEEQIAEVQSQMAPLQAEVTQLQKDIAVLSPAWSADRKEKVAELQARLDQIQPLLALYQQIYTNLTVSGTSGAGSANAANNPSAARLEKTLFLYQQIYLNLINTREAIRLARMQNTQSVNQIEVAVPAETPIRPKPIQNTLLGGMIGLMLAGGAVFLVEYLDDTIKTPEDVERIFGLPMIGYIADMELDDNIDDHNIGVYVAQKPRSPVAEAFRSLRTNLEFSSVDKPLKTILVTSAEAADGKSTVSVNLSAIFAQSGKRVMLIDCDLRRPRIHRFIGVQNRIGMTDLFRGSHMLDEVIHKWSAPSGLEISIITSGALPPHPAELLGSQKMDHILEEMLKRADIIIIDSPPSMVADAQVLAAKVDGVVIVSQPGKTHAGAASITISQLNRAGARIIGVVFNRIQRQRGYYGYRYYSHYYYQHDHYLNNEPRAEQTYGLLTSLFRKVFKPRKKPFAAEQSPLQAAPPAPVVKKLLHPAGWQTSQTNSPNAPAEKQE